MVSAVHLVQVVDHLDRGAEALVRRRPLDVPGVLAVPGPRQHQLLARRTPVGIGRGRAVVGLAVAVGQPGDPRALAQQVPIFFKLTQRHIMRHAAERLRSTSGRQRLHRGSQTA